MDVFPKRFHYIYIMFIYLIIIESLHCPFSLSVSYIFFNDSYLNKVTMFSSITISMFFRCRVISTYTYYRNINIVFLQYLLHCNQTNPRPVELSSSSSFLSQSLSFLHVFLLSVSSRLQMKEKNLFFRFWWECLFVYAREENKEHFSCS